MVTSQASVEPPAAASGPARSSADAVGSARRGYRLFASPIDEPRARRATDVVLAAVSVLGLALLGWVNTPPASFERALIDLFEALPDFFDGLWQLLYDSFALWALVLLITALARRRFALARDLALASVAAVAVSLACARIVQGSWPDLWAALRSSEPPPYFPSLRVALVAAIVLTASPDLSRPTRRLGSWLIVLGTASVALLGAATPTGVMAGVLVALLAAAAVHLVFGSCAGRPSLSDVEARLREVGVSTSSLGVADRQAVGAFLVHATDLEERPLVVKVYGRDAADTQLLAKLWRAIFYRESGSAPTLNRLQQAEHEAFLSLLARQAGVRTQEVVTAGATTDDDALLVLRIPGQPLADLGSDRVTDRMLREIWREVSKLHNSDIAHGQLDPGHIFVDGKG